MVHTLFPLWLCRLVASVCAILILPLPRIAAQQSSLNVTVKEGDGALNNIRTNKAKEAVVVVTGEAGKPVQGASVVFLVPELGASAIFPSGNSVTVTTGPDGVASGGSMRPNNVVGEFEIRVVASYQGQTARTVIRQTNAAPQKAGGSGAKTAVILAVLGGAGAAVALGVTRGGSKSSTPAPGSSTSISVGGSTFGPPQ